MNRYADCTYCGGEVVEQAIDYDCRRQKHPMVVTNVPAGVCLQCGEKYLEPDILKKMDSAYHGIFERHEEPQRTLTVPACPFERPLGRFSITTLRIVSGILETWK